MITVPTFEKSDSCDTITHHDAVQNYSRQEDVLKKSQLTPRFAIQIDHSADLLRRISVVSLAPNHSAQQHYSKRVHVSKVSSLLDLLYKITIALSLQKIDCIDTFTLHCA